MPPIPPSQLPPGQKRPSVRDKLFLGMLMGGTVGGIMGFIYGTVTIFQYGAGSAGVLRTLGKYIVGSGGMFSVFMGIGSIIRTEAPSMSTELWLRSQYPPLLHPRTERKPHLR